MKVDACTKSLLRLSTVFSRLSFSAVVPIKSHLSSSTPRSIECFLTLISSLLGPKWMLSYRGCLPTFVFPPRYCSLYALLDKACVPSKMTLISASNYRGSQCLISSRFLFDDGHRLGACQQNIVEHRYSPSSKYPSWVKSVASRRRQSSLPSPSHCLAGW